MMAPVEGPARAHERSNYEDIDKPTVILATLRDLVEGRISISVRPPNSNTAYASTVVSVDRASASFLIDEVLPLDANRQLRTGMSLRITTKVREVDTSFKTIIIEANKPGSGLHALRVPTTLRRYQKRSYFRAKCPSGAEVRLGQLDDPDGEIVTAELRDLSIGGVGIRLAAPLPPVFAVGAVFSECEIRLDPNTLVRCSLEIRHLEHLPLSRFVFAGCRMLNLERAAQNTIARSVARMDLDQLSRRK